MTSPLATLLGMFYAYVFLFGRDVVLLVAARLYARRRQDA